MRLLAHALCILSAAALAAAARAEPAATVDGSLLLDDRPTVLTQAYVIEVNELPEMQLGPGPTRYLTLLLTDRPFPDGQRPSEMAAHQLSFAGALRGIGFDIDPATGEVMSGRTLLPEEDRPQFFTVITMGAEPMVVLEDWAEADGRLRGHVRTPEPLEVVNFSGEPGGPTRFTVSATFDAPIVPAPVLAETLEGAAAKGSVQADVLRRFIEGVASGDADAVQAVIPPDHPMQEMLTPEGLEQVRAMMITPGEDPASMMAQLSKVYLFEGGSAVAVLLTADGGSSTFPLKEQDGRWLMGLP